MDVIRTAACSSVALVFVVACLSCGNTEGVAQEKPPAEAPLRIESLDVGEAHACVLVADGSAYCWGTSYDGETGDLGFTLSP
jgi:alpha-tubulin suppressor-like RCC1 family protein